jgi:catechol 2,3-dioxygenase-like lactoylglutathione lyase family enzyme
VSDKRSRPFKLEVESIAVARADLCWRKAVSDWEDQIVPTSIAAVALVVRDYDEAVHFYTHALGFVVIEDTQLPGGKRWVTIRPCGGGTALLLARATSPEQEARVGDQTGGRVFLFLQTDDFWRDYHEMLSRGIRFAEEPRVEIYGTVVVFFDLYGNRWDLVGP